MKTGTIQLATKMQLKNETLNDREQYSFLNELHSVSEFVYRFIGNLKNRLKNKHENLLKIRLIKDEN